MCSWTKGHCSSLHLVSALLSIRFFLSIGDLIHRDCFPSPVLPSHSTVFVSVTGVCFFTFHMGAHGWVARICQPWEQSPSSSWLLILKLLGVSGIQPPRWVGVVQCDNFMYICTGGQNYLIWNSFKKNLIPQGGQTRQTKSSSQLVNLPGAQPLMKPLDPWTRFQHINPYTTPSDT